MDGMAWRLGFAMVATMAAAGLAPMGASFAVGTPAASPRTTPPATALAIITTIDMAAGGLPASQNPQSIAINDADDTIYVANYNERNVAVVNGRTGQLMPQRLSLGASSYPTGVAVDQSDDTVYVVTESNRALIAMNGRAPDDSAILPMVISPRAVAANDTDDSVYVVGTDDTGQSQLLVSSGRLLADSSLQILTNPVNQVAVDQGDDTVYVTGGTLRAISARALDDSATVTVGAAPWGVAVQSVDDTVYVTNNASSNLSIVDGQTAGVVATPSTGAMPYGVGVDETNSLVYVAAYLDRTLVELDGRTAAPTGESVSFLGRPFAVAVDQAGQNSGLVYVTFPHVAGNPGENAVAVLGHVAPEVAGAGGAGSTASITLSVPHLAAGYLMDDSTIISVSFDGATVAHQARAVSSNSWDFTVPPGDPGSTVPVTVTLNGGQVASAGTFTYPSAPPVPASPPRDVRATAGDASATVTWSAPESPGSFPVTDYRVTSQPGDRTCVTSELSCDVSGLTNGTPYTFTVEALTAAGWSAASSPSNGVTPRPSPTPTIVITGSRADRRISVTGETTGLGMGGLLRPWVKLAGDSRFTRGHATILVNADGSFEWGRRTSKETSVYIATADRSTRSNLVVIAER